MNEHYYVSQPTSKHDIKKITYEFNEEKFTFNTDSSVFSRNKVDKGTEILLKNLPNIKGRFLDLGCGYGVISIIIKSLYKDVKVTGIDINSRAILLAKDNAELNNTEINFICSDGIQNLNCDKFDFAVINPPIRAGKAVIYRLFNDIHAVLKNDGELYIVIRTNQGAKSAVEYLKTLFNDVDTVKIKSGYRILRCGGKRSDEL